MPQNKYAMPNSEVFCRGFCFKVLLWIKSDAFKFDQGLRNHIALTQIASPRQIWDVFPMKQKTMHWWHEPNKEFGEIYCLSDHWSVCMGRNEIITPQELDTLWEWSPSVVPREANHETWSKSVRATGKQPTLLSFIESTFSQRILRKQKTSCLKYFLPSSSFRERGKKNSFEVLTN